MSVKLKPWEQYNSKTYKSGWTLFKNYITLVYKVLVSHLHVLCYLFMILAVVMNGGLLYMVYPMVLFGIALCEEEKPGKNYWYYVIYYT